MTHKKRTATVCKSLETARLNWTEGEKSDLRSKTSLHSST